MTASEPGAADEEQAEQGDVAGMGGSLGDRQAGKWSRPG